MPNKKSTKRISCGQRNLSDTGQNTSTGWLKTAFFYFELQKQNKTLVFFTLDRLYRAPFRLAFDSIVSLLFLSLAPPLGMTSSFFVCCFVLVRFGAFHVIRKQNRCIHTRSMMHSVECRYIYIYHCRYGYYAN